MFDAIQHWPLFITAGLLLNITPGADMALIASRSAGGGYRAGAVAALGVSAGCTVHILAGALGVAALLAGSELAFLLLRWLGAAYLVWLGLGLWRQRPAAGTAAGDDQPAKAAQAALQKVFAQGFLTNALNPKIALFFLAFVPQFIQPQAEQAGAAFVLLGAVFVFNGTLVNLVIALMVASLARRHQQRLSRQGLVAGRGGLARWLNRGVGSLFIALGLRLALAKAGT